MSNIYFVTYRTFDEEDKAAVCGDNDPSHDYWIKTDHYNSEEKMINSVFDKILDNDLLDMLEADLEENLSGNVRWGKSVDKSYIKKINEESVKIKKTLDKLFPKFDEIQKNYSDNLDWDKRQKALDKHCKGMAVEEKKKFISIVEKYFDRSVFGVAYGKIKVR